MVFNGVFSLSRKELCDFTPLAPELMVLSIDDLLILSSDWGRVLNVRV